MSSTIKTTTKDDYCGFLCSDITERQAQIIKDINDFAEYNREFAIVMYGKCIEALYNASMSLPKKLKEVNIGSTVQPEVKNL